MNENLSISSNKQKNAYIGDMNKRNKLLWVRLEFKSLLSSDDASGANICSDDLFGWNETIYK